MSDLSPPMRAETESTLHRALADPHRLGILAELRASESPLDATELGRRVGLHANTVRWHLRLLGEAGLVESHPLRRETPGRPRRVFEVTQEGAELDLGLRRVAGESRSLAAALVGALSETADGPTRAASAGRAWGRTETAEPDAEPVGAVVAVLERHGFEPVAAGREIDMHRCPYLELARETPQVVCAVHRGLLDGVLEGVTGELRVEELRPFARPGVCVARLGPRLEPG